MVLYSFILFSSLVLLYAGWSDPRVTFLSASGLIIYYGVHTISWGHVLGHLFSFDRLWRRLFGFLVGWYVSAFAIGIPVVLWKYDRMAVLAALCAAGLFGIAAAAYAHKKSATPLGDAVTATKIILQWIVDHAAKPLRKRLFSAPPSAQDEQGAIIDARAHRYHFSRRGFWALFVFGGLFLAMLVNGRTGVYILSPWDALPSLSLMVFFGMAFYAALLVFSHRAIGVILPVLVVFSLIAHAYLPVVYETGFGGDKWRHLGAEQWLQEGNIYTPSVWGEARSMVSFGPIGVPEALVAGNKTSYAALWAVTIMLAESLGVELFWIDLMLVFILWSVFIPLIFYQIGVRLVRVPVVNGEARSAHQLGVLLAFLPMIFYTFQSEGAITIPVSFGHLFFFFVFLSWLEYVRNGSRVMLWFASILSLSFYWGYILNFFVLVMVGILAILYRRFFMNERPFSRLSKILPSKTSRENSRMFLFALVTVSFVAFIPLLEIFQGLSSVAERAITFGGLVDAMANAFGMLSGFIGVIVPPSFIDQGNFLFNQTAESLSRLPLFSYHAVPFIVSSLVWAIIAWGIYRLVRYGRGDSALTSASHSERKVLMFVLIIFLEVLCTYFISWSFTDGVHILARRLNETIAMLMAVFLGWGIWTLLWDERIRIPWRKKIIAVSFFLAFAATATYASGPKLQVVTADELRASEIIWSQLQDTGPPYCVIGNTWPLLGLEAVSGRRIIGGGFPVYTEYAQPERVKIFEGLEKTPSASLITDAFAITGADTCFYMRERRGLADRVLEESVKLFGEPNRIGEMYIWKIEKSQAQAE